MLFALLLTKRQYVSLTDMQNDAIEVEVILMASRKVKHKIESEKKKVKEKNQPSTSQSSNAKFDLMLKTMERIVDKLSLDNRPIVRDQPKSQIRNPNFRRSLVPQIR